MKRKHRERKTREEDWEGDRGNTRQDGRPARVLEAVK